MSGKTKKLIKKMCPKKRKHLSQKPSDNLEVIGGSGSANNENWPPEGGQPKKKYVVNKTRTTKQSFDRLKKHVPTLEGKDDVTQLDVLLEAIQYIHALRKDLGKDQDQPQQQQQPRQLQPFKSSDVN